MSSAGVRTTNASVAAIRARLAAGAFFRGARPRVTDLPTLSAVFSILIGGIVLVGWWLGIDGLKSLVPGSLTMP